MRRKGLDGMGWSGTRTVLHVYIGTLACETVVGRSMGLCIGLLSKKWLLGVGMRSWRHEEEMVQVVIAVGWEILCNRRDSNISSFS